MSLTSGIKIDNTDLILYLDVFNTPAWNIGRKVFKDISNRKNDATVVGTSLPQISNTQGYLQFLNGNAHHLEINSPLENDFAFGTGDFTIEAWIYPENFNTYTHIFCLGNQNTFALKANITDGKIYFTSSTFTTFNDISNWTLNLNQWNQVVLKRQSGIAYCYLNGAFIGSKTGFNNNIPPQLLALVRNGGIAEYSQTRFRQLLVYRRALTDTEITLHHRLFSPRAYIPLTSLGTLGSTLVTSSSTSVIGNTINAYIPVRGTGGTGPLTYSISPALPDGMIFNPLDGEISGRPTGITSQTFTITITDAIGNSVTRNTSITVTAPPLTVIRPAGTYNILVNSNVSITPIIAEGGFGGITYSISPSLPTGLSFNSATGSISGTPTVLSSLTSYTITAQDQITPTPQSESVTVQIQVFPAELNVSVDSPIITTNTGTAIDITPVSGSGGFGILTYSINPSLPSGLSFNTSNGNITGTATSGISETQFTVTIVDEAFQTVNGSFALTVFASLYNFTTFTFTNAGATGQNGPTLSNCLSSYNTTTNPWLNNTNFFNVVTQGFQLWTVPQTATYRITAAGAGGGSNQNPGFGASIRGDFNLTQGQKLKIVVGQTGGTGNNPCGNTKGGGGGGSFVATETNTALIIAGGGGGGSSQTSSNKDASLTNSGKTGVSAGGVGGTGGGGGGIGTGCVSVASGGGGFTGNGTNGNDNPTTGGQSFTNGAVGGLGGTANGGSAAPGGFGGGGGGGTYTGGGGGGYSGGGGGGLSTCSCSNLGCGGGGGSFNSGTNTLSNVLTSVAMGSITIEKL